MLSAALGFARSHARLLAFLCALAAVAVVVAMIFNAGGERERDRQDAQAGRVATKDAGIKEGLAEQRQADLAKAADTEKGLTDATADLPDTRPSDRRLRFNCERLRRQGADLARVPECGGSAAGG